MGKRYSELLSLAVSESGLKLNKIAEMIGEITGKSPTNEYLSRLQNGKTAPAGDKLNEAISKVLGIDPIELKAAAYREKIPAEVLAKLQSHPKASSA
ncbi:helix-turn-helix domain-containing protein [Brevibacillus choshinensis]|uniref:Helix-turn-helix transcriptional regulator n=1 Tax=Brevibacillus choshinensis TaxID=54911 RepID=A0ABX7FUA6_BRECH|nr:helix-turn-helix transcriptional regulator [Brevibacillus choshinensis]QRG68560.1 helix-turn-helix transcriptional regulator [Brevibacillus choshinensis]